MASSRPPHGQVHRGLCIRVSARVRCAFVENHHDVGAETALNVDNTLRTKKVRTAVEVRPEAGALFGQASKFPVAEDLVPSAVCQNRPVPAHEMMESSQPLNPVVSGPEVEMVGVCKNDLRVQILQPLVGQRLDGPGGP